MFLNLRLLGLDLLSVELNTEAAEDEAGDCTTYPVGFSADFTSPPREAGRDYEP